MLAPTDAGSLVCFVEYLYTILLAYYKSEVRKTQLKIAEHR